ncbi:MAG: menaquinone biosynthesis protein [Bacteroidota bacterium]
MSAPKIRISAVRYANTYPFIYGITKTGFDRRVIIEVDHPAQCAEKLIAGRVDIGLIPVAALPLLDEYHIITDYCLGAYGKVRTVMLLSNCPFNEITAINLDYRSRSSVTLARILARKAWKHEFMWKHTDIEFDFLNIPDNEAVVLIGDQCFAFENKFRFGIDLSEEWHRMTGLPFAFACWTSNKKLDNEFINEFNEALSFGVRNIAAVVAEYGKTGTIRGKELMAYLTDNMDFDLNDDKRKAIELFLELMKEL